MVTYDEIKNYYNNVYYDVAHNKRPLAHYDVYLRYLSLGRQKKILDIGCGGGAFVSRALKKGYLVSGIDISEKIISFAKGLCPGADLKVGNAEALPWPDNFFDGVVCLGSL